MTMMTALGFSTRLLSFTPAKEGYLIENRSGPLGDAMDVGGLAHWI